MGPRGQGLALGEEEREGDLLLRSSPMVHRTRCQEPRQARRCVLREPTWQREGSSD